MYVYPSGPTEVTKDGPGVIVVVGLGAAYGVGQYNSSTDDAVNIQVSPDAASIGAWSPR